jgi:hypothetical protein
VFVLLARSAQLLAVLVAGTLAVVGALALRVPGLITMLVTAALVGAIAAGMVGEAPGRGRGSALDTGTRAAGWTAGVLLVLAGLAALAGAVVTVLVAGAVAGVAVRTQVRRAAARTRPVRRSPAATTPPPALPARPEGPASLRPAVGGLSSRALGEEWLRTAAVLDARIDPVLRRAVAARRESILDELERRDPTGFARWLADVPAPGSNPADHVRDLPAAGSGAA